MRLSSVLSDAITNRLREVEPFMGKTSAKWGTHRRIDIGTVTRQYECIRCQSIRSFNSSGSLICLIAGPNLVSVDVVLKCIDCETSVENWFLVRCADDLFGSAPSVSLIQVSEHLGDAARRPWARDSRIEELIDRADLAYECRLGAGAMIYLRKIYEVVTSEAAEAVGIPTRRPNNQRKNFGPLLREVDAASHIIPTEFAENGYKLFSELSEAIHGSSSESEALIRYEPSKKLIRGLISNIHNRREMADALASLGWDRGRTSEGSTAER